MGATSRGHKRFEKILKFATRKFGWCLHIILMPKMERITVFMRNRESAFWKKGMFFDGELQSSVRILHGCKNLSFRCATPIIMTSMPKAPFIWRKVVPGRRVTRLPELPWASQLFIHFLTKLGKPFIWETKSWLSYKGHPPSRVTLLRW